MLKVKQMSGTQINHHSNLILQLNLKTIQGCESEFSSFTLHFYAEVVTVTVRVISTVFSTFSPHTAIHQVMQVLHALTCIDEGKNIYQTNTTYIKDTSSVFDCQSHSL